MMYLQCLYIFDLLLYDRYYLFYSLKGGSHFRGGASMKYKLIFEKLNFWWINHNIEYEVV